MIKVVTIGSNLYLGTLEETKTGIILKDSMPVSGTDIQKAHLVEYIKRQNLGKLDKPVEIKGAAIVFSTRDLTDDLEAEFSILQMRLKQAEKLAVPELINRKFDELARG